MGLSRTIKEQLGYNNPSRARRGSPDPARTALGAGLPTPPE